MTEVDIQIASLQQDMLELNRGNKDGIVARVEYIDQYDKLAISLESLLDKRSMMMHDTEQMSAVATSLKDMNNILNSVTNIETFNGGLMKSLVDKITVQNKHKIEFVFKCGLQYSMTI